MIKLLWNTQNQAKPNLNNPEKEEFLNYNWGIYHRNNSDKWIFFLLKKIEYKIIADSKELDKNDVLIIIDSNIERKSDFYTNLSSICSKIFLFHLGDEVGVINHSIIYDKCHHVWRTFCSNRYFKNEKINCLPIGYKSGISYSHQVDSRKYKWNFIGTPHKSSRHDLLFQFSEIKPNFTFKTGKFNDEKIMNSFEMSEILSSTYFVPCPNGFVHPETYRIYESLECKCIPIIENSYRYYDRLFPGNPFLKIDKWIDGKKIIEDWSNDKILKKMNECENWWKEYKFKLQEDILKRITL